MEAAVARAARHREHRRLALKASDAAEDVRHPCQNARVVHEIPCWKVVGAVDHDIHAADQSKAVRSREGCLFGLDVHCGIEGTEPSSRGLELRTADVGG